MLQTTQVLLCAIVLYSASAQPPVLNLNEGDVCNRQNFRNSTCKSILNCPTASNDVKTTGKSSVICNLQGEHPVVCCEPPPPGTKSKEMCKKYAAAVFKTDVDLCVSSQETLTEGCNDAMPKEYPHMALIGYGPRNAIRLGCGGSLISERFVLSAAHCSIVHRSPVRWVKLGAYEQDSESDDLYGTARSKVYTIVERINHPEYKEPSVYNDISLYRLDRDVEFNEYIRPICLQTDHALSETHAIATGWGRSWGDPHDGVLQKANVTLQSREQCSAIYNGTIEGLKNGILDTTMFCAGELGDNKCPRSGGPLQLKLTEPYCMFSQIGVTSFDDRHRSTRPAVYTRVSHYISWIESIVWP